MSWLDNIKKKLIRYESFKIDEKDKFIKKLIDYLKNESGLDYTQEVLKATVCDVMHLDRDLFNFVKDFILENTINPGELHCDEYFTMEAFLENTAYNPVTSALFFQMYREDKMQALKIFLHHDNIITDVEAETGEEN